MKFIYLTLCILAISGQMLEARIWTSKDGRTMDADLVSATETEVVVNMRGKDYTVLLVNLSEDDQSFVKKWLEEKAAEENDSDDEPAPVAKPGEVTFDGKPLITGGKVNKYDFDYSPERLETVKKKLKSDDTGFKIAIAVPAGFDPTKPQKVFIPNTAVNNAKQGLSGNFGVVGFFAKTCVQNGWVCLAFDTNLGRKNHDADLYAAMEKLSKVWPESRNWEYAVGGFSGGAKACFWPCAYLLKNDYKVIGAFLAGCNQDMSEPGRKSFNVSKSAYKDIKVFLSNGKWDEVAQAKYQETVSDSLKKNGMRTIRMEMHDGKHNLEYGQLDMALKWFVAKE